MLIGEIRHTVVTDMTKFQTAAVKKKNMPVALSLNSAR